ncbi:MAG: hypothetical protein R3350_10115 [Saprospiraceae bacterium]|nr:hypothetical protein [Saprospiraceae bacterium]
MIAKHLKLCLLLIITLTGLSQAQESPPQVKSDSSIFDHLYQEDPVRIQVKINFDTLISKRNTEDYIPATVTFPDKLPAHPDSWEAEIRVRGRYRRRICDMPPLRLKFDKEALENAGMTKHNSHKLVTHCLEEQTDDRLVMREYLVYKLYNILTDQSYRVQLVEIEYVDAASGNKLKHYGILQEDIDQLEDRLGREECEDCYGLTMEKFDASTIHLHDLFHFMIGNEDWSVRMVRNLKLFYSEEKDNYLAVPYDFDFSGFVNASYAIPNQDHDLDSPRDRIFLGFAEKEEELAEALQTFREKEEVFYQFIDEFELLDKRERKDAKRYISSFYRALDRGKLFEVVSWR